MSTGTKMSLTTKRTANQMLRDDFVTKPGADMFKSFEKRKGKGKGKITSSSKNKSDDIESVSSLLQQILI
jgi:hypothetical protein